METVHFRYFAASDAEPPHLQRTLEKLEGAANVVVNTRGRLISLMWRRSCRDLSKVEEACAAAGVPALVISHVRLAASLKPLKGMNLDGLAKSLKGVPGILDIERSGGDLVLHADLRILRPDGLRKAAAAANVELGFQSHQWISVESVNGNGANLKRLLDEVPGVLQTFPGDGKVSFWAVRGVTDDRITKAAMKAEVAIGPITRT